MCDGNADMYSAHEILSVDGFWLLHNLYGGSGRLHPPRDVPRKYDIAGGLVDYQRLAGPGVQTPRSWNAAYYTHLPPTLRFCWHPLRRRHRSPLTQPVSELQGAFGRGPSQHDILVHAPQRVGREPQGDQMLII